MDEINETVPEFETPAYKVYVKTDDQNRITAIDCEEWIRSQGEILADWTKIDEGYGDIYHHPRQYFGTDLTIARSIPRYKLVDGAAVERTPEEIQADIDALPAPEPSPEDDILSMAVDHEYRLTLLELGVN